MNKYIFFALFILCHPLASNSQTEKIDKAYIDDYMSSANSFVKTYEENMAYLTKLDSLGRLINYRHAIFTANTAIAGIERGHNINNASKSIKVLDSLYELAPDEFSDTLIVYYYLAKGRNLGDRNFPLEQLENFFIADSIADYHKNEYLKSLINYNFAEYHQLNKDYEKSLEYNRKASAYYVTAENSIYRDHEYAKSLVNTGIIHYKLEDYDSSIFYAYAAIDAGCLEAGTGYFTYILLGKSFYEKGNIPEAQTYAQKANQDLEHTDQYSAGRFETELLFGQIYTSSNKLDSAYKHLSLAKEIADSMNFISSIGNVNKALFYFGVKKYKCDELQTYFENYIGIQELMFNNEIDKKEKQLLVQFETKKKEQKISELKEINQKEKANKRLIAFTLIVLALITVLIIFWNITRRKMFVQKLKNIKLEKEIAQSKLDNSVNVIKEKVAIINELREDLSSNNVDLSHQRIRAILESNYIKEVQWNEMIYHFNKLNDNFCDRVERKFVEVSKSDIKLLVLVKMGFLDKEIANAKGKTVDAVKKAKQRLRKKMGITDLNRIPLD